MHGTPAQIADKGPFKHVLLPDTFLSERASERERESAGGREGGGGANKAGCGMLGRPQQSRPHGPLPSHLTV